MGKVTVTVEDDRGQTFTEVVDYPVDRLLSHAKDTFAEPPLPEPRNARHAEALKNRPEPQPLSDADAVKQWVYSILRRTGDQIQQSELNTEIEAAKSAISVAPVLVETPVREIESERIIK